MLYSLFGLFDTLSPKDGQSRQLAADLPYGTYERHRLDLYAPTRARHDLPVIFFVYGGSWIDGDRQNYHFAGRALAALGYIVAIADYRLVPQTEYPGFLQDGAAAFDWVARHIADYGGDPNRIALMGHSAGAYNAAMLALDPAYLRAAGLLKHVKAFVGLSGPYDFFPFDGRISLRVFGAVDNPKATQPVNLVSADAPPSFLGHGGKDDLVAPRNTQALAEHLRQAGVPVVEKLYPALDHPGPLLALGRVLRRRAPVLADVAAFLEQWL